MNGNRWVGLGHNSVFEDFAGEWWTTYHAVDRFDPYFAGTTDFTKRPLLLDPIDWVDGWPQVRGGLWASDEPMPAPAAQPGDADGYPPTLATWEEPGRAIDGLAEEFADEGLDDRWEWVREPAASEWGVAGGVLRFETQPADLHQDNNSAPVLTGPLPGEDWIVETRLKLNLPAEGCCFNYVQAGLVVYDGDDSYIKLVHVSIWETRQTEFAKEVAGPPARYGNTVVGPPGDWTTLRVAKTTVGGEEHYRAYTSDDDGVTWVRGGVWTHTLGTDARIGLVSMGGEGFTAEFDYVRVYRPAAWPSR
jgi:arabinan endo-1,5-alpha-L-arabinosidase